MINVDSSDFEILSISRSTGSATLVYINQYRGKTMLYTIPHS